VSKSRVAITAGAVFLSAALAVVLLNGSNPEPSIDAEKAPIQTPVSLPAGGLYVEKIKWSTWSQEGATGSGIFSENLCEPSCAEGQRVEAPVNLVLTNLTEQSGKYYLRTLDTSTPNGKDFPWGRANRFEWDVMEFAEMMDSNGL
jgi:hypothetical protein